MSYRFREAREKAGLSAAEVGRRIGVSQPAVTQWETGTKVPSVEMLCKLSDLYCVSTDFYGTKIGTAGLILKNTFFEVCFNRTIH